MIKMSEMSDAARIKPLTFLSALALAPLSVGLVFLALALIASPADIADGALAFILAVPFVAMFLGAPSYLTFGAYALHTALAKGQTRPLQCALYGTLAHLASMPLAIVIFALADPQMVVRLSLGFLALGLIFAPLWSAVFAALYKRMS